MLVIIMRFFSFKFLVCFSISNASWRDFLYNSLCAYGTVYNLNWFSHFPIVISVRSFIIPEKLFKYINNKFVFMIVRCCFIADIITIYYYYHWICYVFHIVRDHHVHILQERSMVVPVQKNTPKIAIVVVTRCRIYLRL